MENQFENVPEAEPLSFRAGDFVHWRKPSLSLTYPPGAYALEYVAVLESNGATRFSVEGSAVDGVFEFSALNGVTAGYLPGVYHWTLKVTRTADGASRTIDQGRFEVLPDLAGVTGDQRSHNERMLDQINSLMEGRAKSDADSYEIAGRKITKLKPQELIDWQRHYQRLVNAERGRRTDKKKPGRTIHKVRFV